MDDRQLLQHYVDSGSQDAFRQLVDRHVNLVYSAALRQVRGDRHLAEDVAQSVFLLLSQKAAKLTGTSVLAGWLFETARYSAAQVLVGHTSMQVGQLTVWRRAMGFPPMGRSFE